MPTGLRAWRKTVLRRFRLVLAGQSRLDGLRYRDLYADDAGELEPGQWLASSVCRQEDFGRPSFRHWMRQLEMAPALHRKLWEYWFITHALHQRGLLGEGRRGLGFAVGREPLVALFAREGCHIVASDMATEAARASGWVASDQFTGDAAGLNERGICPADAFATRVGYRTVDMNAVPDGLTGFDFCWSACSLEHLGSIDRGLEFILRSVDTLKPGGVAVHTTEFNLSSNDDTLELEHLSLFRRRDIERVIATLSEAGHRVEPVEWALGEGMVDGFVDVPPYGGEPHLRLRINKYDCTSLGLIIQRSAQAPTEERMKGTAS